VFNLTIIPPGLRIIIGPLLGSTIISDKTSKMNKSPSKRMPFRMELVIKKMEIGTIRIELGLELPGSNIKIKLSIVIVNTIVIYKNKIVSDLIIILDEPKTIVWLFGSIKISDIFGKLNEDSLIIIPPRANICEIGNLDIIPVLIGSNIKLTLFIIITTRIILNGKGIIFDLITILLGLSIINCPLDLIIVIELNGIMKIEPLITISGGIVIKIGSIGLLIGLNNELIDDVFDKKD
jgi:hypothetical protein